MSNDFKAFKIFGKMEKELRDAIGKEGTKQIGEDAKKIVQDRTREGFGINETGGRKQKLPKLKESTKKIRKNLKSQGKLSGKDATVSKSNMSRSGRTLDGIKVKPAYARVTVELDADGKNAVKTTEKISKNYNFMGLSKSEITKVYKGFEARLMRALSKFK